MSPAALACLVGYPALLVVLTIYGLHRSWLLFRLRRFDAPSRQSAPDTASSSLIRPGTTAHPTLARTEVDALPTITVQLPIYNERFVVERLIDAACALDYPRDRLEIQVLDDSDDETSGLAAARVAIHRARGTPITQMRRNARNGFKAGALEAGLQRSAHELVAIFDADFVPPPDFLRRLVGVFDDPQVGMVQARWSHLNADYSRLTRTQATLLDGHFQIEHRSRFMAGHFFNFNGTAGIWRRACILEAGGWQHDTLTEDLDLSYRAQLLGWRFVYRPEVVVPAELPVELNAFKSQQRRWAKGSVQTGRKLLGQLLRARVSVGVKVDAFFHLTSNLCYLWMGLLALLLPPAVAVRADQTGPAWLWMDLALFVLSTGSVAAFYLHAMKERTPALLPRLLQLPQVMALGIGIGLSNGLAVLEALSGQVTPFVRTPKHRIEGQTDRPRGYHVSSGAVVWLELAMAAYLMGAVGVAVDRGWWGSLPFLILFAVGYGGVAWGSLARPASLHLPVEPEGEQSGAQSG